MMERLQSSKGVIRLLECYEDEASVHLVTELCAGGDLQKYIEVGAAACIAYLREPCKVGTRFCYGRRTGRWRSGRCVTWRGRCSKSSRPVTTSESCTVCVSVLASLVAVLTRCCANVGDVKPANFCLKDKTKNPFLNRTTSYLKAIDFGCSQFLTASRRLSKRTGTPVFMAPEIFARDYADKADVWSIGVMLYWWVFSSCYR